MPNIKSAKKRMKTSEKDRLRNKAAKSLATTVRSKFLSAASAGDKEKSLELYKRYCSAVDKAAKKGAIAANTAARRKSRAMQKLSAIA